MVPIRCEPSSLRFALSGAATVVTEQRAAGAGVAAEGEAG